MPSRRQQEKGAASTHAHSAAQSRLSGGPPHHESWVGQQTCVFGACCSLLKRTDHFLALQETQPCGHTPLCVQHAHKRAGRVKKQAPGPGSSHAGRLAVNIDLMQVRKGARARGCGSPRACRWSRAGVRGAASLQLPAGRSSNGAPRVDFSMSTRRSAALSCRCRPARAFGSEALSYWELTFTLNRRSGLPPDLERCRTGRLSSFRRHATARSGPRWHVPSTVAGRRSARGSHTTARPPREFCDTPNAQKVVWRRRRVARAFS